MEDKPPICTTVAECQARDGTRITVVGVYRQYPDLPGFDYSGLPRGVRIELDDGPGPLLEPSWSKGAIRPPAEIAEHVGKRVRVTGLYHKDMPINPRNPQGSMIGGACIEVETIEPADHGSDLNGQA